MSLSLVESIERIQLESMKRASAAYSKELELGMNNMVQAVRQVGTRLPVDVPAEEPEGEVRT